MDTSALLNCLDRNELTYEATSLITWEIGAANNIDSVAKFMYKGGPFPPQAALKPPRRILLSEEDQRPEKKYWEFVKEEMATFLCTSDERYKELWKRIDALENKSTTALVAIISAYIGEKLGVEAALLAGFVAVCLYGAIKIGKEALCRYLNEQNSFPQR